MNLRELDEVANVNTTLEGKLVLIYMLAHSIEMADYSRISDISGLTVPEVADAATMLKVAGLNKSQDFNTIRIDPARFAVDEEPNVTDRPDNG